MQSGATQSGSEAALSAVPQDKPGLLLVDDDPMIVETLVLVLKQHYTVYTAPARKQTRTLLQQLDQIPSLALVDLGLPPVPHEPEEGFRLINELLALNHAMKILVLSGQSGRNNIQHALTLGAVDFIPKPCDVELLKSRLQHQIMILDAEQAYKQAKPHETVLLGESAPIRMLRSMIRQFANSPFPVLIEGESGTGKELVARQLHVDSPRAEQPFLTLNCAAFTPELLEAQLFGYAKGAFTGATSNRTGFFEAAGEGSLLLDEIGELPLDLQSKLLRVLENGEYYRLGETQPRQARARIIAATNRDLRATVRDGGFRQDLFHRLGVLTVNVPPLRDRDRDCLLLLEHFRQLYAIDVMPFRMPPESEACLLQYPFPGNVRELRNIVIRLLAKHPGETITPAQLSAELEISIAAPQDGSSADDSAIEQDLLGGAFDLDMRLQGWERRYIDAALKLSDGNLSKAARLLGINRTTLYSRIQRLSKEES
jgi:DNA-binding NtrC family response regulator